MFVIKNCAEGNVTLIIENAGVDEDLLIQFTILAQDQSTVVGVVDSGCVVAVAEICSGGGGGLYIRVAG